MIGIALKFLFKTKVGGSVMGVVALLGAGLWFYIGHLNDRYDQLNFQHGVLTISHEANIKQFGLYRDDTEEKIKTQRIQHAKLAEKHYRIKEVANELSKKLQRHNFEHLAWKKPGLINRRINRATLKLFNILETETGTFYLGSASTSSDSSTTEETGPPNTTGD